MSADSTGENVNNRIFEFIVVLAEEGRHVTVRAESWAINSMGRLIFYIGETANRNAVALFDAHRWQYFNVAKEEPEETADSIQEENVVEVSVPHLVSKDNAVHLVRSTGDIFWAITADREMGFFRFQIPGSGAIVVDRVMAREFANDIMRLVVNAFDDDWAGTADPEPEPEVLNHSGTFFYRGEPYPKTAEPDPEKALGVIYGSDWNRERDRIFTGLLAGNLRVEVDYNRTGWKSNNPEDKLIWRIYAANQSAKSSESGHTFLGIEGINTGRDLDSKDWCCQTCRYWGQTLPNGIWGACQTNANNIDPDNLPTVWDEKIQVRYDFFCAGYEQRKSGIYPTVNTDGEADHA